MFMQMKKVIVVFAALFCGVVAWANMPAEVWAYPGVRIDYGETTHNVPCSWYVDFATLEKSGTNDNPMIKIMVSFGTEQYEILERHYQFIKQNGKWVFKWREPFGGKHEVSDSGPVWQNVSSERLANDVLYIALNH